MRWIALAAAVTLLLAAWCDAQVCNLKVVTDQSPDFTDLPSLVHSVTAKWPTTQEKCWAMWYWLHLARRQTMPINLHGQDLTDPIMQFNDYGYAMCSTVAGINSGIWHHMGLQVKYWDIVNHTVPECFYDGRWHMYDDSMSAIYTLCDGTTVAGVEDLGKTVGCAASGGKEERGHYILYHCPTATSPNGVLCYSAKQLCFAAKHEAEFNASHAGGARASLPELPYHDIWVRVGLRDVPGGHADSFAMSIALYLRPESVRTERIRDPKSSPVDWSDPDLDFSRYSPTGVIGDPTHASAELGRTLWTEIVQAAALAFKTATE